MSIAGIHHDSHSELLVEAELAQLVQKMQRMQVIVQEHQVDVNHFAQLERSVSLRLDVLAHALATQDALTSA